MNNSNLEVIKEHFSKKTATKRDMEDLLKKLNLNYLYIQRNKHGFILSSKVKDGLGDSVLLKNSSEITPESFFSATQELAIDTAYELDKAKSELESLVSSISASLSAQESIDEHFDNYERTLKKVKLLSLSTQ